MKKHSISATYQSADNDPARAINQVGFAVKIIVDNITGSCNSNSRYYQHGELQCAELNFKACNHQKGFQYKPSDKILCNSYNKQVWQSDQPYESQPYFKLFYHSNDPSTNHLS